MCFDDLVSVTAFESPNTALSVFEAAKSFFNIVIADHYMPEMNIFEFVHQIHSLHKDIPIMCMCKLKNLLFKISLLHLEPVCLQLKIVRSSYKSQY